METSQSNNTPGDEARAQLVKLVHDQGLAVCENPQRVQAVLADVCPGPEKRRERFALVQAMRAGVVEDLRGSHTPAKIRLLLDRLTVRVEGNFGLQPAIARWAVESWALALGVIGQDQMTRAKPVSGVVAGTVTTASSGTPIASARVETVKPRVTEVSSEALAVDVPGLVDVPKPVSSTMTDSRGTYSMNLLPGSYSVYASAAGYVGHTQSVTVPAGSEAKADFRLHPRFAVLAGRVECGYPSLATVSLSPGGVTLRTDNHGAYAFTNLMPGTYTLTASAPGFTPSSRQVTLAPQQRLTVDIRLSPTIKPADKRKRNRLWAVLGSGIATILSLREALIEWESRHHPTKAPADFLPYIFLMGALFFIAVAVKIAVARNPGLRTQNWVRFSAAWLVGTLAAYAGGEYWTVTKGSSYQGFDAWATTLGAGLGFGFATRWSWGFMRDLPTRLVADTVARVTRHPHGPVAGWTTLVTRALLVVFGLLVLVPSVINTVQSWKQHPDPTLAGAIAIYWLVFAGVFRLLWAVCAWLGRSMRWLGRSTW